MAIGALEQGKTIPASGVDQYTDDIDPLREILGKSKALVLMDLDKTLIKEDYLPDDLDRFLQVADRLQAAGITLGLHSDSPLKSLMQFAEMFHI